MDAVVTVLVAVVGVLGGYIVGNWRLKYEHLHERRADAIAELSGLLAAVQDSIVKFTHFLQPQDVDRRAQAAQAQQAFNELVACFRSNEVCLEPDTCRKIEAFMDKVYYPLGDYMDTLDERGYPMGEHGEEGRDLGRRILRETQPLRRELILDGSTVRVRRTLTRKGTGYVLGEPKTKQSRRTVRLTQRAVEALRSHRRRQLEEKLRATEYVDSGLVFAGESGGLINPSNLRQRSFVPLLR